MAWKSSKKRPAWLQTKPDQGGREKRYFALYRNNKTRLYPSKIGTLDGKFSRLVPTAISKAEDDAVSVMVKSEITGKIWKVEATVGQSVSQDDQIIVIESMKMEIPVLAPTQGVVREIRVAEGEEVKEGQIVAVIG